MTIEQLEELGFTVKIQHYRYVPVDDDLLLDAMSHIRQLSESRYVSPRGGMTTVQVYFRDGSLAAEGESVCSLKDNFSYKLGRLIALNRAAHELSGWHRVEA